MIYKNKLYIVKKKMCNYLKKIIASAIIMTVGIGAPVYYVSNRKKKSSVS